MSVQTLDPAVHNDDARAPEISEEPSLSMTFDEYLDWLDEDKHAEWVAGKVIMHSPVSCRHSSLNVLLSAMILAWSETADLGDTYCDPFQMKTGPDLPSRAPDVLFVAKENRHRLRANLLEGPADLVVEIVSPESRGRDRGDKYYEYEQGGVREYWLLDPERRRAEFYVIGADGRYSPATIGATGRFSSTVLAGLWLQVDWLWQEPLPTLRSVLRAWDAGSAE